MPPASAPRLVPNVGLSRAARGLRSALFSLKHRDEYYAKAPGDKKAFINKIYSASNASFAAKAKAKDDEDLRGDQSGVSSRDSEPEGGD